MDLFIKIAMLVIFFGVMIYVGIRSRSSAKNVSGFVLGGRNVGPWLSAFAYGTSYFSAVIFIGYAGQFGWRFGVASTWIGIGNAVIGSLLAWLILARRTRLMTQHYESATMPQFFGKRFDSNALKIVASVIVFIFLIPYTASLFNGLSRLFEMAFGIDYTVCIILMSVLTCIYVVLGGYMATAINDFIQGIIMLVGIVAVIGAVLNENGGFLTSIESLSKVEAPGVNPGGFASFFGADPGFLLFVVILTSLGTWGLPQMVGKFYAIKDESAVKKGTIISTLFALVVAGGCYFLGGFARLYTPETNAAGGIVYDSIIPKMLENLNPILMGVVVVLVLSASMSTLSSLVLTSSSTITLDLVKGHIKKDITEKKQILLMRILLVVFVAISAGVAVFQHTSTSEAVGYIAQLMGLSWGALAGAFLAPFLWSMYMKRTSSIATWFSFITAPIFMIVTTVFQKSMPALLGNPINCGAFIMIAMLILVPLISLLDRRKPAEQVEKAFECYKK